jgi:hypothetical protein
MQGGPSVAPLMTYLGQPDYTRLFLGTLKLSWALWWIRWAGIRSPKRNSGVTKEVAAPVAALLTRCPDWRLATRVVTYRRVEWAIDSFAPYKSPGVDGIFLVLLQQAREVVIPYLVRIFRACLATGSSSYMVTGEGSVYT